MNRLQKFVEKGAAGEGPIRTAYVLNMNSLPKLAHGMVWDAVPTFRAGDELLDNPDLKDVFKMALEKGCAIVTPKAHPKSLCSGAMLLDLGRKPTMTSCGRWC